MVSIAPVDPRAPVYEEKYTIGNFQQADLVSPWLVSAGQTFPVVFRIWEINTSVPGDHLRNATCCLHKVFAPHVPSSWDYRWIPSDRPLWAVLQDVVQHGIDFPRHGPSCSCLDKYASELNQHMSRALPDVTAETYTNSKDWAVQFDGRMRVKHVLRMVAGAL